MTLRVNGQDIPDSAIEFEMKRLRQLLSEHATPEQLEEEKALLREKARQQAIGTLLLRWEAERLDIQVPLDDVETRIRTMIANAGGENRFKEILRKQGLTLQALRQSIENGRRIDLLVERIVSGYEEPRENDLRAYYTAHREQYRQPARAHVLHILMRPASKGDADRAVTQSRLLELRAKLELGGDFATAAAAHSDCPSGRKSGGSLGWITRGSMVPEFDRVVFALKVGQLSGIIETALGFHILLKREEDAGGPTPYEECCDKIRELLRHNSRGHMITAYVADLKAKAEIVDDGD